MNKFDKKDIKYGKYFIFSIVLTSFIVVIFFLLYYKSKNNIYYFFTAIILLSEVIFASIIEFLRMTNMTKMLFTEYRKDNHLFYGALGVIAIIITLFIALMAISKMLPDGYETVISTLSTALIGLTPALLSLMGIHYSNTIQAAYRRDDLRNVNKPFPIVTCKNLVYNENVKPITKIKIDLKIDNAVDNVCIPLYIEHCKHKYSFPYSVVTPNMGEKNFINIIFDTGHELSKMELDFKIGYKDALDNTYESEFILDLLNFDEYTLELTEAKIIN